MKQSDVLAELKTITEPSQMVVGDGALTILVNETDAMAARILEFTITQFPNRTVGQVADALQDALWWQKFLYSMVLPDEPSKSGGG